MDNKHNRQVKYSRAVGELYLSSGHLVLIQPLSPCVFAVLWGRDLVLFISAQDEAWCIIVPDIIWMSNKNQMHLTELNSPLSYLAIFLLWLVPILLISKPVLTCLWKEVTKNFILCQLSAMSLELSSSFMLVHSSISLLLLPQFGSHGLFLNYCTCPQTVFLPLPSLIHYPRWQSGWFF